MPVWIIGQAGHDDPPRRTKQRVPDLIGHERLYDLKGQVYHKAEFINKYVPENVKIHLMGHSIGAYEILELLRRPSIKNRVQKEYLLFPTVERLGASPNGKIFTRLFPLLTYVALFIAWLFTRLPYKWRVPFVYIYFYCFSIPAYFVGTALKYMRPSCVHKAIFLACDEMDRVGQLDTELIEANQSLLKFYYGAIDGWTPISYYDELKRRFPKIDAELCKRNIEHAFVLRKGPEMGYMVAEWIQQFRAF